MKLLLVCTSGGHFFTMRRLESFWSQHERVWVTDYNNDTRLLEENNETVCWWPYQAPRKLPIVVQNIPKSIMTIAKQKPDLIVSTGASISVNFAIAAKMLGVKFIFVESVSRSVDLSLSGKIVYPFCSEVYVQWPSLCKKYHKAKFEGYA